MELFLCSVITKPRLVDFSISELISLANLYKISCNALLSYYNLNLTSDLDYSEYFTKQIETNPYIFVYLPSRTIAKSIASRSVCTERFTKHISQGSSIEELVSNTFELYQNSLEIKEIISEDTSFSFRFDTYLKKAAQAYKDTVVKAFSPIPFKGKVDLVSPSRVFIVSICGESYNFGLEVAKAKVNRCSFYNKYNLSNREYLGPTTTDIELALMMANQGQVTENSVILDPFVGTGGILIAASHFGALCYGGDIDMRVIKGLGVGRSTKNTQADIFTNFKNYGFNAPEIFRCDNSNPCLRPVQAFDAIICDPPYGVRAGSRKSHKHSTEVYESKNVFYDLLEFASGLLRTGGRLVYLLPTERSQYNSSALPSHPLLKTISNSENILSTKISRRLITMEKLDKPLETSSSDNKTFYEDIRNTWFRKEMR
jgi:tRNA (guanine10-N2)-methyltransferase